MASALPRALLLFLLLAATAWAQEEASSPISLPPASAPTSLHKDSVADSEESTPAPVSQPPTSSASSSPASAPSAAVKDSPPAPPKTSPIPAPSVSPAHAPSHHKHPHSASTPAPAPAAADKKADDDEEDKYKKEHKKKAPAPAPVAAETIKAANVPPAVDGDGESHQEMNGGKKAGVVVGAFTAAAVVGLGAFVWKKRRANIRRARYADYSARLELV